MGPKPKVFMARTPMPCFRATGRTSCWKERKWASMALMGICRVSNLKAVGAGDVQHVEVDGWGLCGR